MTDQSMSVTGVIYESLTILKQKMEEKHSTKFFLAVNYSTS